MVHDTDLVTGSYSLKKKSISIENLNWKKKKNSHDAETNPMIHKSQYNSYNAHGFY